MTVTWEQVLAWRLHQQLLDPVRSVEVVQVVRQLCGVHAQVSSSAEMAVAVRRRGYRVGEAERALQARTIIKTWAMRGTLHLLAVEDAGAYLALLAEARTWEKGAWQRTFLTTRQMAELTDAVCDALAGGQVLSRDELIVKVAERINDARVREQLTSGWGTVLKPLAWQGYLCNGPSQGNRVTFTRPDTWVTGWKGLPPTTEAARVVIPAYLGVFGPAGMDTFDQWLCRGASKRATLRSWFKDLEGELSVVEVQGEKLYARAADVDAIASTRPHDVVRLLPAFDQYVLAPGTNDTRIINASRRKEISKVAGWIAPVVVWHGRVCGVWEVDGSAFTVRLFSEESDIPRKMLDSEIARVAALYDIAHEVTVSID